MGGIAAIFPFSSIGRLKIEYIILIYHDQIVLFLQKF